MLWIEKNSLSNNDNTCMRRLVELGLLRAQVQSNASEHWKTHISTIHRVPIQLVLTPSLSIPLFKCMLNLSHRLRVRCFVYRKIDTKMVQIQNISSKKIVNTFYFILKSPKTINFSFSKFAKIAVHVNQWSCRFTRPITNINFSVDAIFLLIFIHEFLSKLPRQILFHRATKLDKFALFHA